MILMKIAPCYYQHNFLKLLGALIPEYLRMCLRKSHPSSSRLVKLRSGVCGFRSQPQGDLCTLGPSAWRQGEKGPKEKERRRPEACCPVFVLLPGLTHGVSSWVLLKKLSLIHPKSKYPFWHWLAVPLNSIWFCWPPPPYIIHIPPWLCLLPLRYLRVSLAFTFVFVSSCGFSFPWCYSVLRTVMRSNSVQEAQWMAVSGNISTEGKEDHVGGKSQALLKSISSVCYK